MKNFRNEYYLLADSIEEVIEATERFNILPNQRFFLLNFVDELNLLTDKNYYIKNHSKQLDALLNKFDCIIDTIKEEEILSNSYVYDIFHQLSLIFNKIFILKEEVNIINFIINKK